MSVTSVCVFYISQLFENARCAIRIILSLTVYVAIYCYVAGLIAWVTFNHVYLERSLSIPRLLTFIVLADSTVNTALGVLRLKSTCMIYGVLSCPISPPEFVLAYVGSATTRTLLISAIALLVCNSAFGLEVAHPTDLCVWLLLISCTFTMIGFCLGIWLASRLSIHVLAAAVIPVWVVFSGGSLPLEQQPPWFRLIESIDPVSRVIHWLQWVLYGSSPEDMVSIVLTILTILTLGLVSTAIGFRRGALFNI